MNNFDMDECSSRGACTTAPNIAAMQEIILLIIQKISYYKSRLKHAQIEDYKYDSEILHIICILAFINDYEESQLYSTIIKALGIINYFKDKYIKNVQNPEPICDIPLNSDTRLPKMISFGESILRAKYIKTRNTYQNLIDILVMVAKSAALNLKWLNSFDLYSEDTFYIILKAFDIINRKGYGDEQSIKDSIFLLSGISYNMQIKIGEAIVKSFGKISKTSVSFSSQNGKAILVSGNNLYCLEKLLKDTQDKDIDIYTHSELLISHTLENFKNYPHLKAHYGSSFKSPIRDFGTFPGAILLTDNSPHTTDYYYRGRIYSLDDIDRKGVIKLEDTDFSQVIDSALDAKGFSSGKIKQPRVVGYNPEELYDLFENIAQKLKNDEIKRIYIVWVNSYSKMQEEYFKKLFDKLNDDEVVISLYYTSQKSNVYTIDMGQSIPLGINMLNKLFELCPIDEKFIFYITTCDVMTFSDVINVKNMGAKNIYIMSCPPAIINPTVLETFKTTYDIKSSTTLEQDMNEIRDL
jgi:hydroxylamine reductase